MIRQLGVITCFIQVRGGRKKTVGKGGRKESLSDKTRVNVFDFLTRTRELVFLLLLKFLGV